MFVLLIALTMSMLIFSPAVTLNTSAYNLASSQQPSTTGLSALALTPCGNINFSSGSIFATDTSPQSVAIGDIDGDGLPDLVTANSGHDTVSVLRNTSTSGSISFASRADFATGNYPSSVAIGDIDGDGKPDLAVVNGNNGTVSVFRNTSTSGNISFANQLTFFTNGAPSSVAIGDIDGDGKLDLAVANEFSNTVSVLRNTSTSGSISFASRADFVTGSDPISVAIGDLDGNGKTDLEPIPKVKCCNIKS